MPQHKPDVVLGHREGILRKGSLSCHPKRSGHEPGDGSVELQCKGPVVESNEMYFRR